MSILTRKCQFRLENVNFDSKMSILVENASFDPKYRLWVENVNFRLKNDDFKWNFLFIK